MHATIMPNIIMVTMATVPTQSYYMYGFWKVPANPHTDPNPPPLWLMRSFLLLFSRNPVSAGQVPVSRFPQHLGCIICIIPPGVNNLGSLSHSVISAVTCIEVMLQPDFQFDHETVVGGMGMSSGRRGHMYNALHYREQNMHTKFNDHTQHMQRGLTIG